MEKIDVLIATYNGEKYLEKQINSILLQTYSNINILIRDDGSKDNTCKILNNLEKKDNRIKVIRDNLGNLGFVKNFEELLKNSNSNYVMFSDQDDVWHSNKIEISYNAIKNLEKENENIPLLVHTNSQIMNFEKKTKKLFVSKIANNHDFENSFFNFFVQGATAIINRKMVNEALPFNEKVYLHDRYFHLIAEFIGKRKFVDLPTVDYRQHLNNEIGTNSIIGAFKKRYFIKKDRELIDYLYRNYQNKLNSKQKEKLLIYFDITNQSVNRFKRLYLCLKKKIPMILKKKIFLLLKG